MATTASNTLLSTIMTTAHAQTRALKIEFPNINYKAQFAICLKLILKSEFNKNPETVLTLNELISKVDFKANEHKLFNNALIPYLINFTETDLIESGFNDGSSIYESYDSFKGKYTSEEFEVIAENNNAIAGKAGWIIFVFFKNEYKINKHGKLVHKCYTTWNLNHLILSIIDLSAIVNAGYATVKLNKCENTEIVSILANTKIYNKFKCDCCNTARDRNSAVIIQDINNNVKIYGKSCYDNEFYGALKTLKLFVDNENENESFGINFGENPTPTKIFVCALLSIYKQNNNSFLNLDLRDSYILYQGINSIGDIENNEFSETAESVLNHFKNFTGNNEFTYKFAAIIKNSHGFYKFANFYKFAIEEYLKSQIKINNSYNGNAGDKITITFTKLLARYNNDIYNGNLNCSYYLTGKDGRIYLVKTYYYDNDHFESGTFKATIKNHYENKKGEKITVLTRIKKV